MWEDDFGTEEQLEDHLREEHALDLEPICQHMLRRNAPDALHSVYCQAIAAKCRGQLPIAGSSLDRTALHSLAEATAGNNVEALICCSCGGIHPYVAEVAEKGNINWYQPLQRSDSTGELFFLGQPLTAIIGVLGLQSYLSKYNLVAPGQVALTAHESFHEWCLKLPGLVNGDLLCCPEDRKLPLHRQPYNSNAVPTPILPQTMCPLFPVETFHQQKKTVGGSQDRSCSEPHGDDQTLCEHCWVPICAHCFAHLSTAMLPPLSYANDMWTGYGLERIYRQNVTAIELLCASPCLTSMVLMSMESKYKQEASVAIFDEQAHMARHRYGARGSVITFPLPVEDLLQKLQQHLASADGAAAVPRTGQELSNVFRVILKTNKTGKTTDQEIKTLIHQARVRRQVRGPTNS